MKNGKLKKYKEIKELKTIEKDIRQLQQTSLSLLFHFPFTPLKSPSFKVYPSAPCRKHGFHKACGGTPWWNASCIGP